MNEPLQSKVTTGLAGLGLRQPYLKYFLQEGQHSDVWLEWLIDNYFHCDQNTFSQLENLRQNYNVAFHGVGMNLGSSDPMDPNYLAKLKELVDWFEPFVVSDHLAFVKNQGKHHHDLLPIVLNEQTLQHLIDRIDYVQNYLKRPILIENPSTYLLYQESDFPEAHFLRECSQQSGCGLLVDVNNVWVNSQNHDLDPKEILDILSGAEVGQIHLAGHLHTDTGVIDTHGCPVSKDVWGLFRWFIDHIGPRPTLIEWDQNLPPFSQYLEEAVKVEKILAEAKPAHQPKHQDDIIAIKHKNKSHWEHDQNCLSQAVFQPDAPFLGGVKEKRGMSLSHGLEAYRLNLIMGVRNQLGAELPRVRDALTAGNFNFFVREFTKTPAVYEHTLCQLKLPFLLFLQNHHLLKEETHIFSICEQEIDLMEENSLSSKQANDSAPSQSERGNTPQSTL